VDEIQDIGIWQIKASVPQRLQRSGVQIERDLENWIENAPSLLRDGLTIIGRQIGVEAGKLDLLALDPVGNWVVIEIKRGNVRRRTIAQALDYAACIAEMTFGELAAKVDTYLRPRGTSLQTLLEERDITENALQERNVIIFVAGTGRDPGLDRIAKFLSSGLEINVVNFQVFEGERGQRVIVRRLTELDTDLGAIIRPDTNAADRPEEKQESALKDLFAQADANGIGSEFRFLYKEITKHGLYPRLYKRSIMYTPPTNRSRFLITVWVKPRKDGALQTYVGPSAFAEFYPISEREARRHFGPDGWLYIPPSEVKSFIAELDRMFKKINREKA
jgi:hypothetical protein